eukprot:ANDGO_02303.mRNA.1 hypothetical protein
MLVVPSTSGHITGFDMRTFRVAEGFPRFYDNVRYCSSPIITDVNHDGIVEIASVAEDGTIQFLHLDGSVVPGLSFNIFESLFAHSGGYAPSEDQDVQFVFDHGDLTDEAVSSMRLFSEFLNSQPTKTLLEDSFPQLSVCSLSMLDLDGDGNLEFLMTAVSSSPEDVDGFIIAGFKGDGTVFYHPDIANLGCSSHVLVHLEIDINGDEIADIILLTKDGCVTCVDGVSGKVAPGFPLFIDPPPQDMIVSDINFDERVEICTGSSSGSIRCMDASGVFIWEYVVSGAVRNLLWISSKQMFFCLTVDGYVWRLDAHGMVSEGFPSKLEPWFENPVLSGKLVHCGTDVVFTAGHRLYSVNSQSGCFSSTEISPYVEGFPTCVHNANDGSVGLYLSARDSVYMFSSQFAESTSSPLMAVARQPECLTNGVCRVDLRLSSESLSVRLFAGTLGLSSRASMTRERGVLRVELPNSQAWGCIEIVCCEKWLSCQHIFVTFQTMESSKQVDWMSSSAALVIWTVFVSYLVISRVGDRKISP